MRFVVTLRTELSVEEIYSRFDFTLAAEEFEIEVVAAPRRPVTMPQRAGRARRRSLPARSPAGVAADLSAILAKLGPAPAAPPSPTSSRRRASCACARQRAASAVEPRRRPPARRARRPTMPSPRASARPSACASISTASTS